MDVVRHNSAAWDKEVDHENIWTRPVSSQEIEHAKLGTAKLVLTPTKPVPEAWYMPVKGKKILCLACGGGQQTPLFAALGADVTVFDNSRKQLDQDRFVAQRDHLRISTVQGDMKDLSCFETESFDFIFHPVSNCFVDKVEPVWRECFRVLKKGGILLAAFSNPLVYIFDIYDWDQNRKLTVKNSIPYSDLDQLPKEQLEQRIKNNDTLEYGHSLESQIGGQLAAGFLLSGFYEDTSSGDLLDKYIPSFIATRAVKPM